MPTPATAKWPRPKSEDEWEDMVVDAMRLLWQDPTAQRHGRRGQRQNGVDVFGSTGGRHLGAQAKNMDELGHDDVVAAIEGAEHFQPQLNALYFAVAGPRDATCQNFIRLLSEERIARGAFGVHVLFFDDICQELAKQAQLVEKYWGAFRILLTRFVDALPSALDGPVLDFSAACDRVAQLEEFKALGVYLEAQSGGRVRASMRIDETPQLDAVPGSVERSWRLVVAESHETHLVTLCRVAVDVDSGALSFYSGAHGRWISRDEWGQTRLWFL